MESLLSVARRMNKTSTVAPTRNPSITAGAWARGPPASSTPSAPSSQPQQATPSTSNPAQPVARPTNGQIPHSRRSSAAFPNTTQPPSAPLKDPVAVSKNASTYSTYLRRLWYILLPLWCPETFFVSPSSNGSSLVTLISNLCLLTLMQPEEDIHSYILNESDLT